MARPVPSADDKTRRRRVLVLLLIVGGVAAAAPLIGTMADERTLVVELPSGVERVKMRWLDGDDVVWSYEGAATSSLEREVRIASGQYIVRIELFSGGTSKQVEREVEIVDEATRVVIPIR